MLLTDKDSKEIKAKAIEFAKARGHGFFLGKPPLSQVKFALFDPLHGFTNEAEYQRSMVNDYAEEYQGTLNLL